MPNAFDAGDRKLLIGAGVLLAILLVASTYLSPKENTGRSAYPSSYSAQWAGAQAPYLLLQNLHYHVERWEPPSLRRMTKSPPSLNSCDKGGASSPAARAPPTFCPTPRRSRKAT